MMTHFHKIGYYLFFIIIAIEIIFLGIIWNSKHQDISFQSEALSTLKDNWTYTKADGMARIINLPTKLDVESDESIVISHVLPSDIQSNSILATLSTHKNMYAYIDNTLFYSSEDVDISLFDLTPGSIWNIIKLPKDSAGKLLTFEIRTENHDLPEIINEIYVGSNSAFLFHILQTRGINFIISFIILLIGLFLIITYLSLMNFLKKNKSILFLGMFSVLVSIWMIMESNMTQFFMENKYLISTIKYLCLMTLPIPMLFYISLIENYRFKKMVIFFNYLFIGNVFIMLFLQTLNILNFRDGLIVLHILMIISFSILFFMLSLEVFKYKNHHLKHLFVSYGFLFLFSMIELISYDTTIEMNTGFFLQFGVLIFMAIVSWSSLRKAVDIVRLSEKAKHYAYLAIMDYMTNCKNRNAYLKELDDISLDREVTIIMADVNNMKYINDTFGHHTGDDAIIKCSQCLLKTFGNGELCYRIGGDEFVCIEYDQSSDVIEEKVEAFIEACAEINSSLPYLFEVSIGYAFYNKNIDKDIYDTVKRADKKMYNRKGGRDIDSL